MDTDEGRAGVDGLEDDDGRGWCCFEAAVSTELVTRLEENPMVRTPRDACNLTGRWPHGMRAAPRMHLLRNMWFSSSRYLTCSPCAADTLMC